MLYYWSRVLRILVEKNFQPPVSIEHALTRTFRVGPFDCDGLRVMTAFQYAAYMDFIRWEMIARSKLYQEIILKGFAPTLGSQKIIYRKPLKIWTRFQLRLETAGWDDKWVYHVHTFEQNGEVKAVGITRSLVWRKDKPQFLQQILTNVGVQNLHQPPAAWIVSLFQHDADIIAGNFGAVA